MFFLSDISNAEFRRRKGSKDKVKRNKKIKDVKNNFDRGLSTVKTGQKTLSTAANVSREVRNWAKYINRGKLFAERLANLKAIDAIKRGE